MDLIACPQCDALYRTPAPQPGERAVCPRCHTVLISPHRAALRPITALALAVVVLLVGASVFPFLEISRSGLSNQASVLDAAFAFEQGPLAALSLAVVALIVLVPGLRTVLVLYALLPLAAGRAGLSGARTAFRWSEAMRPWSMAEVFVLGCAVALVKLADLARIGFGPAFWMFAAVVVLMMVQEALTCRWSIWTVLERRAGS